MFDIKLYKSLKILKEGERLRWNNGQLIGFDLVLRECSDYKLEGYLRYEIMKDKIGDSIGDVVMIPIYDIARLLLNTAR